MSGPLAQSQRMGQMGHSSLCLLFLGSSMPPRPQTLLHSLPHFRVWKP